MRTPTARVLVAGLGLILLALVLLGGADEARAVGEQVRVLEGSRDVVQGGSVAINVSFGVNDDRELVRVTCDECEANWQRGVDFDPAKRNCEIRNGTRRCSISFPEGFADPQTGRSAIEAGEPGHRTTYIVQVGDPPPQDAQFTPQDQDQFEAWITSTQTCRDSMARRSDVVLVSVSGQPLGEGFTVRIVDEDTGETVFERVRSGSRPSIAFHFLWEIPLEYDLGPDGRSLFSAKVLVNGQVTEQETFQLAPAFPDVFIFTQPGRQGQQAGFERTETPRLWFSLAYDAAPDGCDEVSDARRIVPVTESDLPEPPLNGKLRKVEGIGDGQQRSQVKSFEAHFTPSGNLFMVNATIPKDVEVTHQGTDRPNYEIAIGRHDLDEGNFIQPFNSTLFEVSPYTIAPEFVNLSTEVERLQTAEANVNLSYADGSPFSPNDTDEPVEIEFGPVGEEPRFVLEANYKSDGIWNVSVPLSFDYKPLGEYVWRVRPTEDDHGQPDTHNQVQETVSQIVRLVGARPRIDFHTFVAGEEVNGTERSSTVHVNLHAEYVNGVPLTERNVDPSLGGVQLNVKKTNEFGRVVDIDSFIMTAADDDGNWVRTFRIARTESAAPLGEWDLEVVARDDSEEPNGNTTSFPFEVRPAQISIAPLHPPRALVDGGDVTYSFRLTYPDGSLFTEELRDPSRGGDLTVDLERVVRAGQDPETVFSDTPVGIQGGQEWRVSIEADTLAPGNHFFRVTGQDIHGNQIGPHTSRLFTVVFNGEFRNSTSPICPGQNTSLEDPCELDRGTEILATFPGSEGDTGISSAKPVVQVLRKPTDSEDWVIHRQDVLIDEDEFFNQTGQELGENHAGFFPTDESTPTGVYRLFILGRAADDTGFAGYTKPFNITAVQVDREVLQPLPDSTRKLVDVSGMIESRAGDVVEDATAISEQITSGAIDVTTVGPGTIIQWRIPRSWPTSTTTIVLEGRDVFGNTFETTLGPMEVQALRISHEILKQPDEEQQRGKEAEMRAALEFRSGSPFTDDRGEPTVSIIDSSGQPFDEGDARYSNGRWFFTWRPPPDTPQGEYRFRISGEDTAGNVIEPFTSSGFRVTEGTVRASLTQLPNQVSRGQTVTAAFELPSEPRNLSAVFTTGSSELGEAQVRVQNQTVQLAFPTDKTTPLARAGFEIEGVDVHGNTISGDTPQVQIDPQRLTVRFIQQPPQRPTQGDRVIADFVVTYPDGSRMRAGEGSPIVGLFVQQQPLGTVQAEPREQNPEVFRIRWDPPDDARTDISYRFVVSALDRWQNEAQPSPSRAFLLTNPAVPDYLPTPGPNPLALLAAVGAAAGLVARRRWPPSGP